jgi:uridine kinase
LSSSRETVVIGISAVSGGGKTALTLKVTELLGDAVTIHFDDYDDSTIHPENLREWFDAGADYNAWKTPVFTEHLRLLRAGGSVSSVGSGIEVGPARYVVADAPLGRAHAASATLIDFMVYVDTPLDVAMARRILRDLERAREEDAIAHLDDLRSDLIGHLNGAREIYAHQQAAATSDLVLDGQLSLDELAQAVLAGVS